MMNTEKKSFELILLEQMLGTVPKDPDVYKSYIADRASERSKANNLNGDVEEEIETVEHIEEKGWTGFHSDEHGLFIYNYMIKGFLKSAVQTLMENGAIKKIPAYKTWIDKMVFIEPRKIHFVSENDEFLEEPDGVLERPLRVMTMKGPRVSLSRSDSMAEGRKLRIEIELFKNTKGLSWEVIESALEYGKYIGLGQWRSADYGRFLWNPV
jgi:hypothetical protein